MGYIAKRLRDAIRFFVWWRILLIAISVAFAILAVVADAGAGWYALIAFVPATALYGMMGSRLTASHEGIKRLELRESAPEVSSKSSRRTATAAAPGDAEVAATPTRRYSLERPAITVVVTAFNERDYIADCLESIATQTWHDFECVVINDDSTDDTMDIAFDQFSDDARFRFVNLHTNSGLAAARNVGIALARAPWITFVDGDDFLFEAALETRMVTLAGEVDNPWIAGSYCNWVPVPQNQPLVRNGKTVPKRSRVTWLDSLHDAAFVASAPVIRTAVIRLLEGFSIVAAAEDADMWTRITRHGYVFLPTHYTGVAYRQKARSMFRSESVAHASVTTSLYSANYEPMDAAEVHPGTPFVFKDAAPTYITARESFRRNLISLTSAVAQADDAAIAGLLPLLNTASHPYLPWVVDVEQVVTRAAKRFESYEPEGAAGRVEILVARVLKLVTPLVKDHAVAPVPPLQMPTNSDSGTVADVRWSRLMTRRRVHLTAEALGQRLQGHVVLMPSAAYHVKELGPLGEALSHRGIPVAFMVSDRRWNWTEPGIRAWNIPVFGFPESTDWTQHAAGLVALNDWGEEPHDAIARANEFGVATFAKVEGVQDFDDVDVHWTRNAYQTAGHVLCQGKNDVNALAGKATTHVVGSSRLEQIWASPPRRAGAPMGVVNLNFTYGVLEDAREMWVDSVIAAGERAGIPLVFSLHPAEKHIPAGATVSTAPIAHLLTRASVLISRFSTVPFEAMARGVPFVYHNPHGEKVPTFLDSGGAYDISTTTDGLADALIAAQTKTDYRVRCEAFFRNQIDIDPSIPSAERAAIVIAANLNSG